MKRADFLFLPWVVIALPIGVSGPIALRAQMKASEGRPSFNFGTSGYKRIGLLGSPNLGNYLRTGTSAAVLYLAPNPHATEST
jgi:hypothetical protein